MSSQTFYRIAGISLLTLLAVTIAISCLRFPAAARAKGITYTGDGKNFQTLPSWPLWLKGSSSSLFPGTEAEPLPSGNVMTINYNPVTADAVNPEFVIGGLSESGDVGGNSVTLLNGQSLCVLYGGCSYVGCVADNNVTVKGGTVHRELYGGNSERGDAAGNTVTISGGSLKKQVYGGYSNAGNVTKNTVVVSGGFFGEDISGGFCYNGDAAGNAVTFSGGSVTHEVSGGYSDESNASGNTVTISGGYIGKVVLGGGCDNYAASGNTVTVSGGSVGDSVLGGSSRKGNAKGNAVIISGGSVGAAVYGGHSGGSGDVSCNTVTISGNPNLKKTNIYGGFNAGYSGGRGDVSDNTVTVSGNPDMTEAGIYGGFHENGDEAALSGNVLNFKSSGVSVKSVGNFEYYNFYLPEDLAAGGVMLSVTDAADLKGTTVQIFLQDGCKLNKGDKIVLIHSAAGVSDAPENTSCQVQQGGAVYEFSIHTDKNNLWAQVTKIGAAAK